MYTPFIDKYFKDIADIREYNNSADAILDLQAERIDAVFDDITFANTTLSRPENNNLALSGPLMSGPIWEAVRRWACASPIPISKRNWIAPFRRRWPMGR